MVNPITVPIDRLDSDTLEKLVIEFVSRDGTDYGYREASLDVKVKQVKAQLKSDIVVLVFDSESETFNIVSRESLDQLGANVSCS